MIYVGVGRVGRATGGFRKCSWRPSPYSPMRRLVTPSSSLLLSKLELSDAKVYEPEIRALRGIASHFCKVDVLNAPSPRHTLPLSAFHSLSYCADQFGEPARRPFPLQSRRF